jgi:hypothetical protein
MASQHIDVARPNSALASAAAHRIVRVARGSAHRPVPAENGRKTTSLRGRRPHVSRALGGRAARLVSFAATRQAQVIVERRPQRIIERRALAQRVAS